MPHDDRDSEFVETIALSVGDLVRAVCGDDPHRVPAAMCALVNEIIKFRNSLSERPSDAVLVRAIERLD